MTHRPANPTPVRRRNRTSDHYRHPGPDSQELDLLGRAYGLWAADREDDQ